MTLTLGSAPSTVSMPSAIRMASSISVSTIWDSGNGKGQIFVKGEVIKTVPESQIVETLIEEAMRIAEGMETVDGAEPSVNVT